MKKWDTHFEMYPKVKTFFKWDSWLIYIEQDYAKDTSKKVRAVLKAKGNSGKHLCNCPPYGYMKAADDKQRWLVDEEGAKAVRYIFSLCVQGYGPTQIAKRLTAEKIETPVVRKSKVGVKYHIDKFNEPDLWTTHSVRTILSNPTYLGHTVNFRTKKKSYKSKDIIFRPKEDWVIFENTHEALTDQDTYDTVQRLRQSKCRPSRLGEMSVFSGLVYCADCGKKMYLNRFASEKTKAFFNCSSYRKEKKSACSSHAIALETIEKIVLFDLQRVLGMAKENEKQFVEILQASNSREIRKDLLQKEKEYEEAEKRMKLLDGIIQSLYEDKVCGNLTDERFRKMLQAYEQEQQTLSVRTKTLQVELSAAKQATGNIDRFVRLVRKYTEITELTPEIVRTFIERIIVHKGENVQGKKRQAITILYNCVGAIPNPTQH